jgi:hypothetical protein
MLTAVVSGSFHRHLAAITDAVWNLHESGVKVLSPADPRIVDWIGDFLFVASDRVRSVRLVQDRHLESIVAADFVWLVAPDGYVGQSASMEIGFAVANDVPIYCLGCPSDLTLRQYVRQVGSLPEAIQFSRSANRTKPDHFLIDPHAALEKAHIHLDEINRCMQSSPDSAPQTASDLYQHSAEVANLIRIPGRRGLFGS